MFETRKAHQRIALFGSAVALCATAGACAPKANTASASPGPVPPPSASETSGEPAQDPAASAGDPNSAPTTQSPGTPSDPTMEEGSTSGTQAPAAPSPTAAPVADDATVKQFAMAYADVAQLQQQYQAKAAQAQSQEEVTQLSTEMNEEIGKSVAQHGMTIDEFAALARQLESDPELQKRVSKELQSP